MNQEQFLSIVRSLLQVAGTFTTTYGLFSDQQWTAVAGGIVMIAPVAWGIYVHTKNNAVAVVAAMPEVKKIETTATVDGAALAKASADNVVVTGRH